MSAKKSSKPLYSPDGCAIYDFSNEEYFELEVMFRKKAVEPRTKPTLSDISPFINRIVYIELCSLHAVIGVSWSILCPTLAQPLKR